MVTVADRCPATQCNVRWDGATAGGSYFDGLVSQTGKQIMMCLHHGKTLNNSANDLSLYWNHPGILPETQKATK